MKIKAKSIVKIVVGVAAAATAVIAANSFATPNVVVAEENSTTYQQSEQFTADDGSQVSIYESQPVFDQADATEAPDADNASSGLGSSELIIVDEAE